jgi:hypothetical protein
MTRRRALRGSLLCLALTLASCGGEREKSEIEQPKPPDGQAPAAAPEFPASIQGESCCARFCRDLIEAGCADLGATEDACVNAVCPVPAELGDAERQRCLAAQGEAICCSWRSFPLTSCTDLTDPHGTSECGTLASQADTDCATP